MTHKQEQAKERTKIEKDLTASELLDQFATAGFSAKRLAEAYEIYQKFLQDKQCIKILAIAGALIPGGMRNTFTTAIKAGLVDVIISTGANLTHDLIEAFGTPHLPGNSQANDIELSKKGIDRIYNIYLPNKGYEILETEIQKIFPKLPQKELSPSEAIAELGKHLTDTKSLIKVAADHKVPIFCPSITDSILGFQFWMYSQDKQLKLNPQLDIRDFLDLIWNNKRYAFTILGGGVPKHFAAGMMQVSGNSINYAIQITLDRPEHGGVSGASLQEAKSWKKVAADAPVVDVTCDATIAFPLLVSALLKDKK